RVIELRALHPWRADDDRGTVIGSIARQCFDCGSAGDLKGRLKHEIFRWIAGDEQFRKGNKVGAVARGLRARLARTLQITGYISDRGIKLRHGNSETIGRALVHGQALTPDYPVGQPASRQSVRVTNSTATTPRRPQMASPWLGVPISTDRPTKRPDQATVRRSTEDRRPCDSGR